MIVPDGWLADISYKMCSNAVHESLKYQTAGEKDLTIKVIILQLRKCHERLHGHTLPADYHRIDNI
jgi:hypothetical protein